MQKIKNYFFTLKVKWEYEDQLDTELTTGMFHMSEVIDGVRMYPYVEVNYGRYYLERF